MIDKFLVCIDMKKIGNQINRIMPKELLITLLTLNVIILANLRELLSNLDVVEGQQLSVILGAVLGIILVNLVIVFIWAVHFIYFTAAIEAGPKAMACIDRVRLEAYSILAWFSAPPANISISPLSLLSRVVSLFNRYNSILSTVRYAACSTVPYQLYPLSCKLIE